MKVTILYFSSLREAIGQSRETREVPSQVSTAGDLRGWLIEQGGVYAQALASSRAVRIAVDQDMADAATVLRDGAEVAFFPPVTGG